MEFMSCRNNGDDDMASWSRAGLAQNITFRYNVSECNWRASGIGIFGGKGHQVHHCLVTDPIEGGIRIDAQYAGRAFDASEMMVLSDISIYKGGSVGNTSTWNTSAPAILFSLASAKYDIQNVKFENIDLYDSKNSAIMFTSNTATRKFSNICLENINIHNAGTYGLYVKTGVKGDANYYNVNFEGCSADVRNDAYVEDFTLSNEPCSADAIFVPASDGSFFVSAENGNVEVNGAVAGTEVAVYNMLGQKVAEGVASEIGNVRFTLNEGAYVVVNEYNRVKIVF